MARLARSDRIVQQTPYWFDVADGHALGGVHGAGVAQGDVLAQVVALEDDAGRVGEPLGGDAFVVGVDAGDAPAVAVADLVDLLTAAVVCAGFDGDGGVVVAAEDRDHRRGPADLAPPARWGHRGR